MNMRVFCIETDRLLDLGFLVFHVRARFRIKLHDCHFFRHRALVLGGGVEVTSACGRFQRDFVAVRFSQDIYL